MRSGGDASNLADADARGTPGDDPLRDAAALLLPPDDVVFSGKKKWKTKDGTYQLKDPELGQAMPETDEAIYADMLREV